MNRDIATVRTDTPLDMTEATQEGGVMAARMTLTNTLVFDAREYGDMETDAASAIQNAMNDAATYGGGTVSMAKGVYTLDAAITIPDGVTLELNRSTLDFSASGLPAYSKLISAAGSLSALPFMSVQMTKRSEQVTFASAHGLAVGDWFCIYNPADSSYSQARPYYRDGMWCQVVQVVSTTVVRLRQRAPSTFPISCTVHKMSPVTGGLVNGTIVGIRGTNTYGFHGTHMAGYRLSELTVRDCEYAGVSVNMSTDFNISDVSIISLMDTTAPEDHYGLSIANSQHGTVYGCSFVAQSHAIAIGGTTGPGCVPNRWILVSGNQITTTGNKAACDSHGNAEFVTFRSNIIYGGCSLGGDNMTMESNDIHTRGSAFGLYVAESCGANLSIIDNRFHLNTQWEAANGGMITITFTTSSYTGLPSLTRGNGHLEIRGNTFDAGGFIPSDSTALGSLVQVYFANTSALGTKITFEHNKLDTRVSASYGLSNYRLLTVRTSGTTSIEALVVESNDFSTAGLYAWGLNAEVIEIKNNKFRYAVSNAIHLQMATSGAAYANAYIDISDNRILNTQTNGIYILGYAAGVVPIVTLRDNTIVNANGSGNTSPQLGAGVYVNQAELVMAVGNIWGDIRSTVKQTRRLAMSNVSVLVRADNETVGSMTTDVLTAVGVDRAPA